MIVCDLGDINCVGAAFELAEASRALSRRDGVSGKEPAKRRCRIPLLHFTLDPFGLLPTGVLQGLATIDAIVHPRTAVNETGDVAA